MPGFNALRVLSFESRRAQEIAQLIRKNGGEPVLAPSTREVETPGEEELDAIRKILNNEFDAIIFMTGVGARALLRAAESISPREAFVAAISRTPVVVRGPKPAAAMRELGIPNTLTVPEPNTWREIVNVLDANSEKIPLNGRRIAIQEHGEPSSDLYSALRERGAQITAIRVYRWELPQDISLLQTAIRQLADKKIDVVLFTSSIQFVHSFRIARQMHLADEFLHGLQHALVASIGPVCSATLRSNGVRVDLEPTHPKMGFLVKEAAERTAGRLNLRPHV